ncbi:PTS sugar transporter subunit IIB [Atopobium fossor]|uniref:PTS sugar transporter subunit IIB n=1 Tax=Atopobium fossor TaxID=39487 RepID=UPI00041B28FD|nr:PTS sugar transporter subunit IIB [Atopobium fossor]
MIKLVRLDYRLLHGQVVVSWVKATNAQRIIIIDDETAGNDLKKSAIKLAKPAGVRVNIFSVARALEKMPKVEQLDENIILIFGSTTHMLTFIKSYPHINKVNYGATANVDGAKQVGQSVFLTEQQQEDTRELLALGVQITVQQTAVSSAEELTSL